MTKRKPLTLHRLREMQVAGEKLAMLTCYDACFATLLDEAGVDVLLVGDSLGMVLQGRSTTLSVSMDDMAYHTAAVARGNQTAWIIADMPFGSYQASNELSIQHAVRLMQAGAHMVKVEGAGWVTGLVRALTERGIPVCGHLGFTPQSVHAIGGYRVQGRDEKAAVQLEHDAEALVAAGAAMLVLEMVPGPLAERLTMKLPISVIGIGAGSGCSGQVLVLHDMLGLGGRKLKFVRDFMQGADSIADAVRRYVSDVKAGKFPDDQLHAF